MSDTNHKGLKPKGTGRFIAPLLQRYLLNPYVALNRPFSMADARDMLTACAVFLIRRKSPSLSYKEAFAEAARMVGERNAFGEKKYGEGLRANNGYDPSELALEEFLDGMMYVTMELEETGYIAKDETIRNIK